MSRRARAPSWPAGPRATVALLAGLLVVGCDGARGVPGTGCASRPRTSVETAAAHERAWSVQLHVHGSFSEGVGSIDSHSFEASDVGADVIWWSDHDFRITSYRHASIYDFEDWEEPLGKDEPWGTPELVEPRVSKGLLRRPMGALTNGSEELTSDAADDGARSLRVRGTGDAPEFATRLIPLFAARGLVKRPLASDVVLDLSIRPESAGADARAVVDIALSEHAPHEGGGIAQHYLRYFVSDGEVPPARVGNTYYVPLRCAPGAWCRVSLPVTRDASAGFPWVVGEDNSLVSVAFGVEARRGATAAALFDRFRIRQALSGEAAFAKQREVIGTVAKRYPRLVEHQGLELSYSSRHLNVLSADPRLVDYDALLGSDDLRALNDLDIRIATRGRLTERIAQAAHRAGTLLSYNHMFGGSFEGAEPNTRREALLARLLENRLYGAELLEVGYRDRGGHDLADHLWVWDELAKHGSLPVGIGVSDSHGGERQRWRTGANNFLSWIYATSPDRADLVVGLAAGRVYFGDLVRFRGTLDLTSATGFRMGQIVVTDATEQGVRAIVDGAVEGDSIAFVESGRTSATTPVTAPPRAAVERTVALASGEPVAVRFELRDSAGEPKVLSNPIVFTSAVPSAGIPGERAAIDLAGARCTRMTGVSVRSATSETSSGGERIVTVGLDGQGGHVRCDLAEFGEPAAVELVGVTGRWSYRKPELRLDDLAGAGSIVLRSAR
ncbi:MAG: hypothetical protein U0610_03530 [bacterium]